MVVLLNHVGRTHDDAATRQLTQGSVAGHVLDGGAVLLAGLQGSRGHVSFLYCLVGSLVLFILLPDPS